MPVRQIVFKQEGVGNEESIELQIDADGTISRKTLDSYFPGMRTLKYFSEEQSRWKG